MKIIDLFAGIGGMRLRFEKHGCTTVFSSEIDKFARKTYQSNFGELPKGDIRMITSDLIPDHDILLAGFPCQPFSQAGLKGGFDDTRGTLFFEIARILEDKKPKAFLLENVKNLRTHDKGRTLKLILEVLREEYYVPEPEVLNAYNFGVPQSRERIFIVGFRKDIAHSTFYFPKRVCLCGNVGTILEDTTDYTLSDKLWSFLQQHKEKHKAKGNGFGYTIVNADTPYTPTITARYYKDGSECLVEQIGRNPRMLTPRGCARLQGFPDDFKIVVSRSQAYKQFGNSVCVPLITELAESMLQYINKGGIYESNKENNYISKR